MNIKRICTYISFFTASIISSCAFGSSAMATTVDDVAAVARSYGYSEDDISQGYNAYYANTEKYPSEILDQAIAYLHASGSQIIDTAPQQPGSPVTTETTAETPTESQQDASADTEQQPVSDLTLTASDGSTFTRISREKFIAMSYDDKMAYVHSFTTEQQQAIIDDLSPEEYRAIIKQSPAEQKLKVVEKLSEAAGQMGLNITVDEITDDSLTVAMRNDKGELLNVSTAGVAVDDTGYDRRGLLAASAAFIGIGITSAFMLIRRMKKNETEN
ncbi:hypothetical protein [Ruminococcus sp.]